MAQESRIISFRVDGKELRFQTVNWHKRLCIWIAYEINPTDEPSKNTTRKHVIVKQVNYTLIPVNSVWKSSVSQMKRAWERMCKLKHANVLACQYAVLDEEKLVKKIMTGIQVMDYSPKGDLQDYINNNQMHGEDMIKNFTYQILQGIKYLHTEFRMIHGDLKPCNIVLFHDADTSYTIRLKIIDFDHHAALLASVTLSQDGKNVLGTDRYMSPEMRQPNSTIHRSTDMWSFGCIVVAMLNGATPLEFAYYPGTTLTDPFDSAINSAQCERSSDLHAFEFAYGAIVPCIPPSVVDPKCKNFLKACLTVDEAQRAKAGVLLDPAHPLNAWIADQMPAEELAEQRVTRLLEQRRADWLEDIQNYPEKEWREGIRCAAMLLTHFLVDKYNDRNDRITFETMSEPLLQQLQLFSDPMSPRTFSEEQMKMCVEHLAPKPPALSQREQSEYWRIKSTLDDNPALYGKELSTYFPPVLSLQALAKLMNDYVSHYGDSENKQNFTVTPRTEWHCVKVSLDRDIPVICQIVTNERDQDADALDSAEDVQMRPLCPLKLVELEFVIVNGYKVTKKGETLLCITKAGNEEVIKTLADFTKIWNWNASDPLVQKYLESEGVFPGSVLLRS